MRAATSGGENHTVFFYAKKPKHTTRVEIEPTDVAIEHLMEGLKETSEDSNMDARDNEGTTASIFKFAPISTSTEFKSSVQVDSMLGKRKEPEDTCDSSYNQQTSESLPKKRVIKQTTNEKILEMHGEIMEYIGFVYNHMVEVK